MVKHMLQRKPSLNYLTIKASMIHYTQARGMTESSRRCKEQQVKMVLGAMKKGAKAAIRYKGKRWRQQYQGER